MNKDLLSGSIHANMRALSVTLLCLTNGIVYFQLSEDLPKGREIHKQADRSFQMFSGQV